MNLRVLLVLGVTALIVAVVALRGCDDPEEALVRASLAAMVDAVERKDSAALSEWVAVDYTDRLGHDQRAAVRRVIDEVEHYPTLTIELAHLKISIEEASRTAMVRFVPEFHGDVDASKKTRPKYSFQKGQRIKVHLRKHGDRYLVVRGDMGFSMSGAL